MSIKSKLITYAGKNAFAQLLVKPLFILFLVLALTLQFFYFSATPAAAEDPRFGGGSGTEENPYLIKSAEHLNNVREELGAHFRQEADIDLGAPEWSDGGGWIPIGVLIDDTGGIHFDFEHEDSDPFTGVYDGNDFLINNLTINRPEERYVGLFAAAQDAVIKAVTLNSIDIKADSYCGGLVGVVSSTEVKESSTAGTLSSYSDERAYAGGLIGYILDESKVSQSISAVDVDGIRDETRLNYIGGLAGYSIDSSIEGCHAVGSVTGKDWVGGLLGSNRSSQITTSSAEGLVSGRFYVGGLVGSNGFESIIEDCQAEGDVEGASYVGGLVGGNTNSIIKGSHASGEVMARRENAGGLVGESRLGALIEKSSATGNVTSLMYHVGGLVGYNYQSSNIKESFATGNVRGSYSVGGLVGHSGGLNDTSVIENSYALGAVMGNSVVGGLVGRHRFEHGNQPTIVNCYAAGFITQFAEDSGGLVGRSETGYADEYELSNVIRNSYYNTEISGMFDSTGGEGKTTEEMLVLGTFSDWDFADTWLIDEGESYPFHAWQVVAGVHNKPQPYELIALVGDGNAELSWSAPVAGEPEQYSIYRNGEAITKVDNLYYKDDSIDNYSTYEYQVAAIYPGEETALSNLVEVIPNTGFAGGVGTKETPFLIATADHLYNVRCHRDAYFEQTDNINLAGYSGPAGVNLDEDAGWEPIGSPGFKNLFAGSYNGSGYIINNLFINRAVTENPDDPEPNRIGLFGYIWEAEIKNVVIVDCDITGGSYVGGLVGYIDSGSVVTESHVFGTVRSSTLNYLSESFIGGLAGYNAGSVKNSSSHGIVSGGNDAVFRIGGLVGDQRNGSIENSYSTSDVNGTSFVGGLLGHNDDGGVVENSYSVGKVEGDSAVGGLVGLSRVLNVMIPAEVISSYWDVETSNIAVDEFSAGTGKTTQEMKDGVPSSDIYTGWSEAIWNFPADKYPQLIHFAETPEPVREWVKDEAADADAVALTYNSADELTGAFPGFGVWHYAGSWSQMVGNDAVALAYDSNDNLAGAFPGFGIWVNDGVDWLQLAANDATALAYSADGELTANFPGWGIYTYDGADWVVVTGTEANALAYNAAGNLVASFPGDGVFELVQGEWVELSDVAASVLAAGTELAGTFPGFGIWVCDGGLPWTQLADVDATSLAYNSNDDLAGAFGLFGVWYYVEVAE